jgi:diaminopimelate decarboxylase/aspartate kinase
MTFIVTKFGGTSVSTRQNWDNIVTITQKHIDNGFKPVIVCSALTQATNQLEQAVSLAIEGQYQSILNHIKLRYEKLSEALQVNFSFIQQDFFRLEQLLQGISLLKEATPKTRALILSFGEIMMTRLGHAFLNQQAILSDWFDVKEALKTEESPYHPLDYLKAKINPQIQPLLIEKFNQMSAKAIITQGFIASTHKGETVLLSRGGSDTSGALIGAALHAHSVEIWTDVPGIYTANPHRLSNARLIKQLHYDEAQEIATMGAKILHPQAIPPVSKFNIPMYIKCTLDPSHSGTRISKEKDKEVTIKSIQMKDNITLISIETSNMWQQSGFLADIFQVFKRKQISIDLLASSECTITVSLDPSPDTLNKSFMESVLNELNEIGKTAYIEQCAAISIIGHHIKSIIPQLGETLTLFSSHPIYLMSMANNDLNLTFVVESTQAEALSHQLHEKLIIMKTNHAIYAESWNELIKKSPQLVLS